MIEQELGKQLEAVIKQRDELEAQLAQAERMYQLVASERTATLVSEFKARAQKAEAENARLRADTIEECARVVDAWRECTWKDVPTAVGEVARRIARNLRELPDARQPESEGK